MQAKSRRIDWDGRPGVVANFRDLTSVKAATLLKYQAALLDHVSDAVIGVSPNGAANRWDAAAATVYGRNLCDVLDLPVSGAVGTPLDAQSVLELGDVLHTTHFAADGAPRSVRVSAAATDNGYIFVCADLTALRPAEHHFEAVVTAMGAGLAAFDSDGTMTSANPTAWRIFAGITGGAVPFASHIQLYDHDGKLIAEERNPIRLAVASGAPQTDRVIGVDRPDGRRIWLSVAFDC